MSDDLITAFIGFLGVAVGAGIAAWTEWWKRRSQMRDEQRVAIRVLGSELSLLAGFLTLRPRDADKIRARATSVLDTWKEHRHALARLPDEDWTTVQRGVLQAVLVSPESWAEQEPAKERHIWTAANLLQGTRLD
jgi:hypothetical protein